jgi:electron transport complex protein RnfE
MDARALLRNGLVDRNPGFVQLLGLCPLLAMSNSVGNALGLGLATLAVLLVSNAAASLAGPFLPREVRLAVFVLVIAAAVTSVELSMAAWWPGLHASLGIFLPLIVTNCLVLARAESFASREPLPRALLDGLAMGLGFLLALLALGASRELLGRGSLGADLHLLLGAQFEGRGWQAFPESRGLLIALLPPGAFVLLGLMLALGNARGAARRRVPARPGPEHASMPGAPT